MTRIRTLLSWSSGKDSAWMLHRLQADDRYEVVGLLTTVNATADRVAMHAVRSELLRRQAEAARLALWTVDIPSPCTNDDYEAAMRRALARAQSEGIQRIAFGDLFLEDVRKYREALLSTSSIEPIFPLWGSDTHALAREMIDSGLRARITCVDPKQIDASFIGRDFDETLLGELAAGADPCGERGEFHTFAWDGPMFREPVAIETGVTVERDGFVFCDLLAAPVVS